MRKILNDKDMMMAYIMYTDYRLSQMEVASVIAQMKRIPVSQPTISNAINIVRTKIEKKKQEDETNRLRKLYEETSQQLNNIMSQRTIPRNTIAGQAPTAIKPFEFI